MHVWCVLVRTEFLGCSLTHAFLEYAPLNGTFEYLHRTALLGSRLDMLERKFSEEAEEAWFDNLLFSSKFITLMLT